MKLNAEVVTRFLNNECSREEAERISAYFEAHPEELEKYIGEAEWKQYSTPYTLPEVTGKQLWKQIKGEAAIVSRIQRKWYSYAAAAAVFTLVAGSMMWFIGKQNSKSTAAVQPVADTLLMASITNTGKLDKLFTLEDGSEIILSANSTLEYPTRFGTKQRFIKLEGKALFKVAQEKGRPFTVATGGLTTTALGTSFWIECRKAHNNIQVKLITGKVVVQKDTTQPTVTAFKPVYLTPGQELVFDKQAQLASVSDKTTKPTAAGKTAAPAMVNALAFNQRPLPEVLHALENHFHVTIEFEETQLNKMKFSGSYTAADKIDDILTTVTLINDLKLEKTANGYSITK